MIGLLKIIMINFTDFSLPIPHWVQFCSNELSAGKIALRWGLLAVALLVSGITAHATTFSTNEKGVHIDAGSMGGFTLEYPSLERADKKKIAILQKAPSGKSATVTYDGGTVLQVEVSDVGEITYSFSEVPAEVKSWRVQMLIDFSYQQGGKWKIGSKEGIFAAEKPVKPQLFQGNANSFVLTNAEGKALSFHIPDFSYEELVDNRAWGWSIYVWTIHATYNPNIKTYKITVGSGSDSGEPIAKSAPLVDPFGQIKAGDWPDKIKSGDELKADVPSEQAYYASLTPPAFDKYGGLPGSKEKLGLNASGFFHVEKKNDRWLLVDPEGNAFFHLGICAFGPGDDYTLVAGRQSIYEWLPDSVGDYKSAYKSDQGSSVVSFHLTNMIRKYGTPYTLEDFQTRMIDRVRKFGFNSIGAFSPVSDAAKAVNMPYVTSLPLGAWGSGAIKPIPGISQTWDPFDDKNRKQVDLNFSKSVAGRKDDPLLIGYFLANEPLYEDIPKVVPGLKGSVHACKRALVQLLGEKYKTIDAFNTAWGTAAKSFDELIDTPLSVKSKAAFQDVHEFTGLFFETYFKLLADTFHKYDSHHMLIGNRLQPGTINNEQLCRIAGKYLDIMSYNYYTNAVDKDFLNRIYQWTGGRPMILSEFYWAAPKESGLVGGNEVNTQRERGLAYRNYVDQSASLPYIVGIEWFTLVDQASTGRWFSKFSGERANTGLFSVTDRPYKSMLEEMMKANYGVYEVWLEGKTPYAFDDPKFVQAGNTKKVVSIPRATGPIKVDGTTQNWPGIPPEIISGKRLVFGSKADGSEGTFKLCWDDQHLYILATVIDSTPMMSKVAPERLWAGDGLEIFLGSEKLDEGGQLLFTDRHLMVGAPGSGTAPFFYSHSPQPYECEALVIPGGDGKSYTLEVAIPWEALGIKPQVATEFLFDLAIDDSANGTSRRAQLMWNGTDKNSGDRTHWGRAKLLP